MMNPPHFKGFKPIGLPEGSDLVVLNYEEYESIRLSDFEFRGQVEAAMIMNISRPTYARIYESARRKVAQAFIQGRTIVFEGGKVYFDSEWYMCNSCGCYFNHPDKELAVKNCALCGSADISQFSQQAESSVRKDVCICPECGAEKEQLTGFPCQDEICTTCHKPMIRKGFPHQHRIRNNSCH